MIKDNYYQPVPEIKLVFFDYYDEDSDDRMGQITFQDEWNENLGVFNFYGISKDDFKLMFNLWKKHVGDDIHLEFGEL